MKNCIWCNNDCKLDCKSKINKMTKQFKHKQSGDIVETALSSGYYNSVFTGTLIPGKYIENTNDWEEITKPEYTILSFRWQNGNIWELRKNNKYGYQRTEHPIDKFFLTGAYSIHSVRRESDGEIFTINDQITWGVSSDFKCNITGFKLTQQDEFRRPAGSIYLETTYDYQLNSKVYLCDYANLTKVQPKEWEITAFLNREKKVIPVINNKVDLFEFNPYTVEECLKGETEAKSPLYQNRKPIDIYSVKRLSDGIEFKIGDTVGFQNNKNAITTISEFVPLPFVDGYNFRGEKRITYTLSLAIKKEKLFTTEDGVDIYENDEYYICNPEIRFEISKHRMYKGFKLEEYLSHKTNKYFSTKKKAEEYRLMNKPCLSLNDIEIALNNTPFSRDSTDFAGGLSFNLKNLVKTKL